MGPTRELLAAVRGDDLELTHRMTAVVGGLLIAADDEVVRLAHRSVEVWLHAVAGEESCSRELAAEVLPDALSRTG